MRILLIILLLGRVEGVAGAIPEPMQGWKMELVAEAPVIKHPTVVCSAPDGRVFVAEDPMDISAPADKPLGRIICFHPDGTTSVFAEGLFAVFGMQYIQGKLLVLHNPKFSLFEDGGRAGRTRRDLIEQTNPNPWALDWNDHVPANFRLGMDGYLYIAVGDKGIYGATGQDGKRVDLQGGGILRMRPDGTELEIYCTGIRNVLDIAMNEEDDFFTYDNTDEQQWMGRVTHMVEGGFYGYPYDFIPQRPYTLWMLADYGPGAATGTLCYNEDALPAEFRGNLFLADFGKRQVMRVEVEREGATYRAKTKTDLFPDPPPDFRPVGIGWSHDGKAMFICDWQHRDVKADVSVGRLWKLSWTGQTSSAERPRWMSLPEQDKRIPANPEQWVAGLSHPARSVRMAAQQALISGKREVELMKALETGILPDQAKWHAIWALDGIDGGKRAEGLIIQLAAQGAKSVRRQAMRQLGTRRVPGATPVLRQNLKDPDPTIRFQAATALGRIGDVASIGDLIQGLEEKDLFVRYAVFHALNLIGRTDPTAWKQIASALFHERASVREGGEMAMRETYDSGLAEILGGLAGESGAPLPSREAALRLLSLIHHKTKPWTGEWWAYHPVNSQPPPKTVEWKGTEPILQTFRKVLTDRQPAMRLLAIKGIQESRDASSLAQVREVMVKEDVTEIRHQAIEAVGVLRDKEAEGVLIEKLKPGHPDLLPSIHAVAKISGSRSAASLDLLLREAGLDLEFQIATLKALGEIKAEKSVSTVARFLGAAESEARMAAAEALTQIGGKNAGMAVAPFITHEVVDIRLNAIATAGKLKLKELLPDLVHAVQDSKTEHAAIEALTRQPDPMCLDIYLKGLESKSAALRESCRKALGAIQNEILAEIESRLEKMSGQALAELRLVYAKNEKAAGLSLFTDQSKGLTPGDYAEFAMNNTGDRTRGREIFYNENGVACIKCHAVGSHGGRVGPEMTTAGTLFGRSALIESILEPSKVVREGYNQVLAELVDGETISGIFKGETSDDLTLLDSNNTLQKIRKTDLKSRRTSALSLMPEGLHSALTQEEFADLISYLESLKSSSQSRP